jgi:hypothetical protein
MVFGIGYAVKARSLAVPEGTKAFVEGNGIVFTAADGSYSAEFPIEPTVEEAPMTVESVTVNVSAASVTTNDYEMAAASMSLRGVKVPKDRVDELLEESLQGGVQRSDAEVVSKERITRGGLPAIDAKLKAPDGYGARALVVLSGSRLYLLFVHAKTGSDRLFNAFNESFVVSPA